MGISLLLSLYPREQDHLKGSQRCICRKLELKVGWQIDLVLGTQED
jgi:hypothetical protein